MDEVNLPEGIISETAVLTLAEICEICSVEEPYIIEMVEVGILEPEGRSITNWQFSLIQMQRLKKAQRLQNDLKLNLAGVALSLELLDQIKELHEYIESLKYQLELVVRSNSR